ncbi:muscle-specific protein 300 kDa isoform X2 [Hyalella azteca]|uniref:Muscle-specific protein 300 kDa isoform X2 n=1 Tax=Hyalella azteca TaxID=294128 RepID=A0A8B7P0Z2_HYAAZ|nr:muscle-specific protein 300 kDa isoform X2 [Hyalella azteca]
MSFWQENYGFVKEVYDFRCSKYLEWMDNIEAIIGKVMANTQYTAKEFKIIKDTFTSLCRDLEKENTKSWLDMMLEKLSAHSAEGEEGLSGRDKAMKAQEKKKLEAMIERHNSLMAPTMEAQSKVAHYSECYAFGDDIHPVMKVLNEQKHLSCKEIHPHTMEMVEDQIDKQEKVLRTIENQASIYNELIKRGAKLRSNPNAPSFLEKEIDRLETEWKETNEKAKIRLEMLNNVHKDWDTYENQRVSILQPLESLEEQYKSYKKVFDPKKGAEWLDRKKKKAETLAATVKEHYNSIKGSFANIVALAGEDKREFMEKEVVEIDERSVIVQKIEALLHELSDFNDRLNKLVEKMAELHAWMVPASEKLEFITTSTELTPEDRVKEIFDLQAQVNERLPLLEPLEAEAHDLLDAKGEEDSEVQQSETAKRHMEEFELIKETLTTMHEKVEIEAGSITQDQKHYAEYFQGVKNFKPWMDTAETVAKTPLAKPQTLEDALKLLEEVKTFEAGCCENKGKLDSAVESKSKMEKQTKSDNEVETLTGRWDGVKKVADERVKKVQELVDTWSELSTLTNNLTETICNISSAVKPDVSMLEGIFQKFRTINENKVKLLEVI